MVYGEAGFLRDAGLPVEHGDFGALPREVVGRGDTDHTAAQNNNFHAPAPEN